MEADVTQMKLGSRVFSLETFVSGGWPKDPFKRAVAVSHLEAIGAAGLIKSKLEIVTGRDSYDRVTVLADQLRDWGPSLDTGVHTMSLRAFARRRLAAGDPIDLDALGLFAGPIVKVKGG